MLGWSVDCSDQLIRCVHAYTCILAPNLRACILFHGAAIISTYLSTTGAPAGVPSAVTVGWLDIDFDRDMQRFTRLFLNHPTLTATVPSCNMLDYVVSDSGCRSYLRGMHFSGVGTHTTVIRHNSRRVWLPIDRMRSFRSHFSNSLHVSALTAGRM